MELGGEDGFGLMTNTLVGAIVDVNERRLPLIAQSLGIESKTVVLAGDVALVGAAADHGVVVGAVTIGQLICLATSGNAEELIAKADAEDGFAYLDGFLDVGHGGLTHLWVARTVAEHETIIVDLGEVIVPRHANYGNVAFEQTTDDVVLGSSVHHHHLIFAIAIGLHQNC